MYFFRPEATAFGNPTFGERTSVTITHRDVNHALRSSVYDRDPRQPVRFVTVAPIPEHEVLPSPTTLGIDLTIKSKTSHEKRSLSSADRDLLVPPDTLEVMEEWAGRLQQQRVADQVAVLLAEKETSRSSSLKIDTSLSGVAFPCASPSPARSEFPERPSAPCPLSPFSDDDDEDFPLGVRPDGPVLATFKSFGESSVAESVVDDTPGAPVMTKTPKNGSSSSLPQTASPVASLTKTLQLKLASAKSRSTSDLALEYVGGAPLSRSGSANSISNLKLRLPVIKKLFGRGKGKGAVAKSGGEDGASSAVAAIAEPKGQKRHRDDEDADENTPPSDEKERRIIKGRNIRRRLFA